MDKSNVEVTSTPVYTGSIPNTPLRFLWYLGSKYKFLGAISFLLVVCAETLNVSIFYVSSRLIDSFAGAESLVQQKEVLLFWGGVFLLVSAGNSILYRASGFTAIYWIIKSIFSPHACIGGNFVMLGSHGGETAAY